MSTLTESFLKEVTPFTQDPHLAKDVKDFLRQLNGAGGPPLETLTPVEARKALADAQAPSMSTSPASKFPNKPSPAMDTL